MTDEVKSQGIKSGLLPSLWGPPTWESLHCITFGYPDNPTEEDKNDYYNYFQLLKKVLPCCECRAHYSEMISTGETKLTMDVMKNKDTLTKWLYDAHCAVTKRTGFVYDISYKNICDKYNSYIAECQLTPAMKIIPYKNSYNKKAPCVPYEVAVCFVDYATKRGLNDFASMIQKTSKISTFEESKIRNEKCWDIIKTMRTNGIHCIEMDGEFKGLPTIKELELLQNLSTTMSQKVIKHILIKFGYNFLQN